MHCEFASHDAVPNSAKFPPSVPPGQSIAALQPTAHTRKVSCTVAHSEAMDAQGQFGLEEGVPLAASTEPISCSELRRVLSP